MCLWIFSMDFVFPCSVEEDHLISLCRVHLKKKAKVLWLNTTRSSIGFVGIHIKIFRDCYLDPLVSFRTPLSFRISLMTTKMLYNHFPFYYRLQLGCLQSPLEFLYTSAIISYNEIFSNKNGHNPMHRCVWAQHKCVYTYIWNKRS